jgi:hypothetical protein
VLAPFTVLHYAGLTLTGRELHAAYERATGVELRTVPFPWWALRLAAPFSGMLRAVLEMRYLWERPHRLAQDKLVALLGTVPASGLDEVVAGTLPATAAHEEPLSVE